MVNQIYGGDPTLGNGRGTSISSIDDPSGIILVGDGCCGNTSTLRNDVCCQAYQAPELTLVTSLNPAEIQTHQGDFFARHLDTANVSFLDGHVKSFRPEVLMAKDAAANTNFKYFTKTAD